MSYATRLILIFGYQRLTQLFSYNDDVKDVAYCAF